MFNISDLSIELYSTGKLCTFKFKVHSLDLVGLNPLDILSRQN